MRTQSFILPYAAIHELCRSELSEKLSALVRNLGVLLQTLQVAKWLRCPSDSPILPHEHALIYALYCANGQDNHASDERDICTPNSPQQPSIAAITAHALGYVNLQNAQHDWAFIAPSHAHVGMDSVELAYPELLLLDDVSSQYLMQSVALLWRNEGIELHFISSTCWLASSPNKEILHAQAGTASIERVIGNDVRPWLPSLSRSRHMQRLLAEAQMLLNDHNVNETRHAARLPVINTLWCYGTGNSDTAPVLAKSWASLEVQTALRNSALKGDWPQWLDAWKWVDTHWIKEIAQRFQEDSSTQLILCGSKNAVVLVSEKPALWSRIQNVILRKSTLLQPINLLAQL